MKDEYREAIRALVAPGSDSTVRQERMRALDATALRGLEAVREANEERLAELEQELDEYAVDIEAKTSELAELEDGGVARESVRVRDGQVAVRGVLREAQNNQPIRGGTVQLKLRGRRGARAVTDIEGRFILRLPTPEGPMPAEFVASIEGKQIAKAKTKIHPGLDGEIVEVHLEAREAPTRPSDDAVETARSARKLKLETELRRARSEYRALKKERERLFGRLEQATELLSGERAE
ncbi:MAG: hypothetical protein ACQEVA_01020 [Myxococcota bacterium]